VQKRPTIEAKETYYLHSVIRMTACASLHASYTSVATIRFWREHILVSEQREHILVREHREHILVREQILVSEHRKHI
jgi:hypothetical protein